MVDEVFGGALDEFDRCRMVEVDRGESINFQIIGALERWPIAEGQIRRCLALKFSYAILYRVCPDRIVIAAIMSCRRDPNYWQDRI
jgi:toxin ParE1/3/4